MKYLLTLTLFCFCYIVNAQNICGVFEATGAKPVKVTFYTDLSDCFVLTYNGQQINPEPSGRVVYYMDYEIGKAFVKLDNGTVVEQKVMLTNTALAEAVYELTKNEKKGTYNLKFRASQGALTEEGKAKQQSDLAAMTAANKQKLADDQKGFDEQQGKTQQKQQEELKEELTFSEAKEPEPAKETTPVIKEEKPVADSHYNAKNGYYPFQFKFNGKPIAERRFIVDYRDTENRMMGGMSDFNGVVMMETDLPWSTYAVDIRFWVADGVEISKLQYTVTLSEHDGTPTVIDFREYVEVMAEMMDMSIDSAESLLGFGRLK
ncbi:MAG: hypothetical protein GC193_11495 [Cryomorphaceae bacterium]|nr:hypothetical protein [Cryomorphaceae bacterium]